MSSAHTNYRLDEAQAIMSELRTIKKAICTGEKERQDLMQVKEQYIAAKMRRVFPFPCWRLCWGFQV